ncbi:MAG: molecular chaperone TorD family protein [Desulfacinum sp.]|nr:molecular chaperone TorD family protein [Desulfacinum sp.]
MKPLDASRADHLAPILAWAKTAARYPSTAAHLEAALEGSEPVVHWLASAHPLLEELLTRWMDMPETTLEAHQVEYTRLFMARWGGVPAPLYASWYLDRETFRGDAAEAAMGFYAQWGVQWRETTFKEPPDHLAVELEFLEILCRAVREGVAREDRDRHVASALWQDFRLSHLDQWVPRCAQAMERHAVQPLYRTLALTLTQFCREE